MPRDEEDYDSDGDGDDYSGSDDGGEDYSQNSASEDDSVDDSQDDGSYSDDDDGSYDDDEYSGVGESHFDDEVPSNRRFTVTEGYADDELEKSKEYWWEGREKLIAMILCCWCCFCLIIIGVVLGVVLGSKPKEPTPAPNPAPTLRPTPAPQPLTPSQMTPEPSESIGPTYTVTVSPTIRPSARPTTSPTQSDAPTKSIPNTLGLIADQDTHIEFNITKEMQGEEYGKKDTFTVQKAPAKEEANGVYGLADAIGLLSFSLKDVPRIDRVQDMEKSATLRLHHKPDTGEKLEQREGTSANYTIIRIPETRTKMEYWHGFYFEPPEDNATGVKVGPEFEVFPTDTIIDIDVSSLFFNYTSEYPNRKAKKVFFMIENRGPDQEFGGDEFFTRESPTPPQLNLAFN